MDRCSFLKYILESHSSYTSTWCTKEVEFYLKVINLSNSWKSGCDQSVCRYFYKECMAVINNLLWTPCILPSIRFSLISIWCYLLVVVFFFLEMIPTECLFKNINNIWSSLHQCVVLLLSFYYSHTSLVGTCFVASTFFCYPANLLAVPETKNNPLIVLVAQSSHHYRLRTLKVKCTVCTQILSTY